VPTLICSRIGARLFEEEIDKGVYGFADTAKEIAAWIRSGLAGDGVQGAEVQMIETSDTAVRQIVEATQDVPLARDRDALNRALDLVKRVEAPA
jgi:hypothetical protein